MTEYFGKEFKSELCELRAQVFMGEQGFSYHVDSKDSQCYHAGLFAENGSAIAVGRAFPMDAEGKDYKLGRIAVKKDARGTGLGRVITALIEREVKVLGGERAIIDAQYHAKGFYESVGYSAETGEIFQEDGTDHVRMVKTL